MKLFVYGPLFALWFFKNPYERTSWESNLWSKFKYFNFWSHFSEAGIRSCSSKLLFLKFSRIWQENTCAGIFRIKLQAACNFNKKTPMQMVSCEIYEIFKNSLFYRILLAGYSYFLGQWTFFYFQKFRLATFPLTNLQRRLHTFFIAIDLKYYFIHKLG